jgi:thiamine-monophosphate kinase
MKLSELGEFGLINILSKIVEDSRDPQSPQWKNMVAGIGDDAAMWKNKRRFTLATTDCLVENVHFKPGQSSWRDLGWKALAVNLSDIAAMGGKAEYALVTIGLPPESEVESIIDLYEGIIELGNMWGVAIAGGDTTSSEKFIVSLTVTGSSGKQLLKRSSARTSDLIAVTGNPGMAAAGFKLIENRSEETEINSPLRQAFLRPFPRLAEGIAICASGGRTAIDISDGLVADLEHICNSSGTGARISTDLIPVHPAASKIFPDQALDMALGGGEDYELLFTAKAPVIEKIKRTTSTRVTVIGEITASPRGVVNVLDENGRPYQVEKAGWDHFGK